MELRGKNRPLSVITSQQSSASKTSEITIKSVVDEALKYGAIDFSLAKLGRKMTPQEIIVFTAAIEHLAHRKEKNHITEFNISGQELGDSRVKKLMNVMVYCSGLRVLNLDQSNLTIKFKSSLLSFANIDYKDLHLIRLDGNDFGSEEPRKIRAMAGAMRTLVGKNKSLTINASHANFPGDIAKELNEFRTGNNDDSSSMQRIFVTDPSEPYHSTEKHFISVHQKSASHEYAVGKTSRKDNSIWECWRQVLEKTVGDTVVVISSKTGRTFCCSPILSEKNRADLIELLQGSLGNPSDDEEITLDFADENGDTARLTRTMANIPSIAEEFIKTACIVQD